MQNKLFKGVETTTLMSGDELIGYYRRTPVASKLGNRITLNTGGWFSNTTKRRMNQFSNNFCNGVFSVFQRNYQWFVSIHGKELPFNGNTINFVTYEVQA
jgi:hypothetical protein